MFATPDASTTGADAEPIVVQPPEDGATCNATKSPSQDPCVVDDALGVFVAPSGQPGAAGTKDSPLPRIEDAIAMAASAHKRVYVCVGRYDELVTLDGTSDGIALYGGLDCANGWAYVGGGSAEGGAEAGASALTTVAPGQAGAALTISRVAIGVTVEDFAFVPAAGANPGDSSVAVVVDGSTNVTIRRCTLSAGAAADGSNASVVSATPETDGGASDDAGIESGAQGDAFAETMDANATDAGSRAAVPWEGGSPAGGNATALTPGAGASNACGSVVSTGGNGGPPAADGGAVGTSDNPPYGMPYKRACDPDGYGSAGRSGDAGAPGSGASTWARFDSTGWLPTPGQPGSAGAIGEAGGGGASLDNSGGGGGGGPGGCGGVGGAGGQGGGSSIALLLVASRTLILDDCTLNASDAGNGGTGGAGQPGQPGGGGGGGYGSGCAGGQGGNGGGGGGGGGGAGGLSAGVVWTASPALTINGQSAVPVGTFANVSYATAGTGGLHGPGGDTGDDGTDGLAGQAAGILELP